MKILLHTCCAPCLIHPAELLAGMGYEVVPYFYNPNIHPFREYRERYFALLDYCRDNGIDLKAGPYDMESFLAEVAVRELSSGYEGQDHRSSGGHEAPDRKVAGRLSRPSRCAVCYRVRLNRTALEARRLGIGRFTSTLLVSPYQDQELIRQAGEAAACEHGVLFHFEDMSGGYRESAEASRELGIYRQSYCGCVYSEKERYQKSDPPRR